MKKRTDNTYVIQVCFSQEEAAQLRHHAARRNTTLSRLVRAKLRSPSDVSWASMKYGPHFAQHADFHLTPPSRERPLRAQ